MSPRSRFRRTRLIPQGRFICGSAGSPARGSSNKLGGTWGPRPGANREISHFRGEFSETTSADLAAQFLGNLSSPSQNAIRVEQTIQLQEMLISLDPLDREILALRHFEQLSNGEAADVLGLDKSAASKRYARALTRVRDVLLPQFGSDL